MPKADSDLYAVTLHAGDLLHGACAEQKWPDGLPEDVTPVFYGDSWRNEVAGMCVECKLFIDPGEES